MSRMDASCICDVSVLLMLNSGDSEICDNCKSLTRTGFELSSTGGSIIVEIGSRKIKCVCHIGSSMTMSVSTVMRSWRIIKFNTILIIIK